MSICVVTTRRSETMHISMKCSIAIHCLIFINEYGESKRVTSELLSLSTGCNPVTIRNIISALKKEGILSVKFGTGGTTLHCPLEEINLYRIYIAVDWYTYFTITFLSCRKEYSFCTRSSL